MRIVIALFSCALLSASCVSRRGDSWHKGFIDGAEYRNEFSGFVLHLPDGWFVLDWKKIGPVPEGNWNCSPREYEHEELVTIYRKDESVCSIVNCVAYPDTSPDDLISNTLVRTCGQVQQGNQRSVISGETFSHCRIVHTKGGNDYWTDSFAMARGADSIVFIVTQESIRPMFDATAFLKEMYEPIVQPSAGALRHRNGEAQR